MEVFEKFESKDGLRMPSIQDVYFAWKLIPLVLFVKYFMEKCIAATFAKWLGVKEEPREKPPSVDILEREHRANPWGKWSHEKILALSKELAWTEIQVRSWLNTRRRFALPTTAEKFSESSWRACVFFFIFTYGLSVHWSKEWLWDIKLCAQGYPRFLACKCSKYLNLLKAKAWWLWIFAFFNCGIWIFTRNIILPLHIIPSIYHYSPFNLPQTFPLSCFHGSCDVRYEFALTQANRANC
ncbi:unnamed protein product [Bemisia tabaci]|uniref:Uncharacterized protein n=1 Tax=Bemisia tabaci TaxID=7038 RepID=A0A9P0F0A7_BEMTA|nr:unnamed protein product [Bemisia tabaci]